MSESSFWKQIERSMGKEGHFSRIESPETSPGFPDVSFCIKGVEGHMELKFGTSQKAPKIRDSQLRWFKNRIKHGGSPIVFAKLELEGVDFYCMYRGDQIQDLYNCKSTSEWFRLSPVVLDCVEGGLAVKLLREMSIPVKCEV